MHNYATGESENHGFVWKGADKCTAINIGKLARWSEVTAPKLDRLSLVGTRSPYYTTFFLKNAKSYPYKSVVKFNGAKETAKSFTARLKAFFSGK